MGLQVVLEMVRDSQELGRHVSSYQQFDTIRKLRNASANFFIGSVARNDESYHCGEITCAFSSRSS